MNKRGFIITFFGIVMIGVSLSIAGSIVPSNFTDSTDFSVPSLLGGMFNDVSDEIQIAPGDSTFVSYSTLFSDVPLLWGVQIIDYQSGDKLSIKISNIFGDDYGDFVQNEPVVFEVLEITQSDTLNFEIQNLGTRSVIIVAMFSEDPGNSDALSNSDSPLMNMILPLAVSGFLLILGAIISIIGMIVILVDWKNIQNNKRNY